MRKIQKPELIVDLVKLKQNIRKIINIANKNNVELKPHFKTHQSSYIGNIFKKYGINKIAVSSVSMARYFAKNGWQDITIAFPFNILEIDEINDKIFDNINIDLLIDNAYTLEYIGNKIKAKTGIFIEIDLGYNRSGIYYENYNEIQSMINYIDKSKISEFKGFLIHSGETYDMKGHSEINRQYLSSINKINLLKESIYSKDRYIVSFGDTPSISLVDDLTATDEIRPGNFVFYDLMQYKTQACRYDEIAVAVAAPIVSIQKERNEIVIYCGAVHLSKEFIELNGTNTYGLISKFDKDNYKWGSALQNTYLRKLSQEHGIIKSNTKVIDEIKIGDLLAVIPVHSCLTADTFSRYSDTDLKIIDKI